MEKVLMCPTLICPNCGLPMWTFPIKLNGRVVIVGVCTRCGKMKEVG